MLTYFCNFLNDKTMSIKCTFGFHTWNGCICSKCGKEQHDLSNDCEKCAKCGKISNLKHDWSRNCNKCYKCGKTREEHHVFINDICKNCGQGTFTDPRDGKCYKVVTIGNQVIMAENLAFKPIDGLYWVYENNENYLPIIGYLYSWETAKKAAPDGWHLPTKDEWEKLENYLEDHAENRLDFKLYNVLIEGGSSGFNAKLGGGYGYFFSGRFDNVGKIAKFWSATPAISFQGNDAYSLELFSGCRLYQSTHVNNGCSVRLFKD